jgi:hypothetical protein
MVFGIRRSIPTDVVDGITMAGPLLAEYTGLMNPEPEVVYPILLIANMPKKPICFTT